MNTRDKHYIPPIIEVFSVQMEEGIAAGSAVVKVYNNDTDQEVKESWFQDDDDTRSFEW